MHTVHVRMSTRRQPHQPSCHSEGSRPPLRAFASVLPLPRMLVPRYPQNVLPALDYYFLFEAFLDRPVESDNYPVPSISYPLFCYSSHLMLYIFFFCLSHFNENLRRAELFTCFIDCCLLIASLLVRISRSKYKLPSGMTAISL